MPHSYHKPKHTAHGAKATPAPALPSLVRAILAAEAAATPATPAAPLPGSLQDIQQRELLAAAAYGRAERALRNAHNGYGLRMKEDMDRLERTKQAKLQEWKLAKATLAFYNAREAGALTPVASGTVPQQ